MIFFCKTKNCRTRTPNYKLSVRVRVLLVIESFMTERPGVRKRFIDSFFLKFYFWFDSNVQQDELLLSQ